jgi:hypothetical protein
MAVILHNGAASFDLLVVCGDPVCSMYADQLQLGHGPRCEVLEHGAYHQLRMGNRWYATHGEFLAYL